MGVCRVGFGVQGGICMPMISLCDFLRAYDDLGITYAPFMVNL